MNIEVMLKERMVQITRQKVGGLGLSIKGGAEHKLPILISRIYKDQAADATGELFVGDAIIKVNGEYITACPHDDAVNILRNAGDLVVLTVKHYKAATRFLQKQEEKELAALLASTAGMAGSAPQESNSDESLRLATNSTGSRPSSLYSESESEAAPPTTKWTDLVTLPLMMAYVTRYIFGTDKLRPNAFEVRGLNGISTGIIHCDDSAILSQWLKYIGDNIIGLTHLQMKLYNRNFSVSDRIEYMGWVNEGVLNNNHPWQNYKPRFFALKGTDLMLFDTPPVSISKNKLNKLKNKINFVVERCWLGKMHVDVQSIPNHVSRGQGIRKCRRTSTLLFGADFRSRFKVFLSGNTTGTFTDWKRLALRRVHCSDETWSNTHNLTY